MRSGIVLAALAAGLTCVAPPATAKIRVMNEHAASAMLGQLEEVDFETFAPNEALSNPLTLLGVTFTDPYRMASGFCSSPTCEVDPDNPNGGNIELYLNPGATIVFEQPEPVVVLDVQGMGDNAIVLIVTEGDGGTEVVTSEGRLFGVTLIGLAAPSGIAAIQVQSVGGTGGPLTLARVLYTRDKGPR
ncbi:MAG TPA: hypothetical protein VJY35_00780 [Candidatus Eisenbacteria bacterium]|nr:hypothetical protein [Candidatus Eisenbacteria bacterium]